MSRFFGGGDDRSRDDVRRFSTIFDSFFRFRAVNNDYTIVCASPRSPGKYRERGAVNEACGDGETRLSRFRVGGDACSQCGSEPVDSALIRPAHAYGRLRLPPFPLNR